MLRRIHQLPTGDQVLVTVDAEGKIDVATRANSWDVWSPPLPELHRNDDSPDAFPRYPAGSRTYDD